MRLGTVLILALATAVSACASGGGGGGGGSGSAGSTQYQSDIGVACMPDIQRLTTILLGRWHYEIYQVDQTPMLRIETHWRARQPFADETALGVNSAESRVIITARQRGEMDVGATYTIRQFVENRVRLTNTSEWNEKTNTKMFRDYAEGLTQMFKDELRNIGVRTC